MQVQYVRCAGSWEICSSQCTYEICLELDEVEEFGCVREYPNHETFNFAKTKIYISLSH